MSIGLVNAKILTFPRTLRIILGTNIGTCLTTELIGLNLNRIAWPMLGCSLGVWLLTFGIEQAGMKLHSKALPLAGLSLQAIRNTAVIFCGFSLLIIGIGLMQSVAPTVETTDFFNRFLELANNSVVWGLEQALCYRQPYTAVQPYRAHYGPCRIGAMPPEIGIAIVLGANIGTCITAVLASMGGTRAGHWVAWSHVALNVGGAILFAPFVHELQFITAWISSSPSEQIAHAQTLFNLSCPSLRSTLLSFQARQSGDRLVWNFDPQQAKCAAQNSIIVAVAGLLLPFPGLERLEPFHTAYFFDLCLQPTSDRFH